MTCGATSATMMRATRALTLRGKLRLQQRSTGARAKTLDIWRTLDSLAASAVSAVLVKGGRGKSGVKKHKVSSLPNFPAPFHARPSSTRCRHAAALASRGTAREEWHVTAALLLRPQVSSIKIAAKDKNKGKKKR